MSLFAEVLLPQKVGFNQQVLTYEIPDSLNIKRGHIVEVPLRSHSAKGVVFNISSKKPAFNTKPITRIVQNAPHLEIWQLSLLEWISDYYFCPLFKTLKLFLPVPFVKKKKLIADMPEAKSAYEFDPKHILNDQQKSVLKKYASSDKKVALLHGITGSGKTEIYLHIADEHLKNGMQVLMLIPEISLTTQTVQRFEEHFKESMVVIHSQLTPKEKEKAWMKIHKGEAKIVIGSRSAIFAPFSNLGVIIMDEEHDSSYKQDQAPRYNTMDIAVKLANILDIKVIAGSATPSLETYYKALKNEYQLLELTERAGKLGTKLPNTHIVDLREELHKKNYSIFSEKMHAELTNKLETMEQSLLFLNRRGAASAVICRDCGYVAKCAKCEVPMTYHRRVTIENSVYDSERIICHHCGLIEKVPTVCPKCKSHYIKYIGLGTQKVEEELTKIFPKARVIRADRDTVKTRNAFKEIYLALQNNKVDVLIGTQMVAIGLHLPKINFVGVVLADLGLTIPNFRSSERTFQLLTQVAGRAGRESDMGEVIIQTYLPNHYAIQTAAKHDFKKFYDYEIEIRKELNYPPFSKLIKLTFKDKSIKNCTNKANQIIAELEKHNTDQLHNITSYPSIIPKLKQMFRWHVLITGPDPRSLLKKCENLEDINIDVDPISTV
jgi:primosomal protein N' (replication factor Y)